MRQIATIRWAALMAPIFAGLVGSTMLLMDTLRPVPVFCAYDGGCDAVKHTAYSSFLGVPTPIYGLAIFAAFAVLALSRGLWARAMLFGAATVGAAVATFLISVQVKLGAYCIYCMNVDISTLTLLGVSFWRLRGGWDLPEARRPRLLGGVLCALGMAVPALIGFTKKPAVPDMVAGEMALTPPGKITIVDFVDYECPYCRETQAEIAPILEAKKDHLRVVRKNVPLTRIHPHAMDAARAACCGEAMGKGDAFADALFATPVEEITPEGCAKIAASLGLDVNAFKACEVDPKTEAKIKADGEAFKATHGHGLPTLWIDSERLEGAQEGQTVEQAIDRAIARDRS